MQLALQALHNSCTIHSVAFSSSALRNVVFCSLKCLLRLMLGALALCHALHYMCSRLALIVTVFYGKAPQQISLYVCKKLSSSELHCCTRALCTAKLANTQHHYRREQLPYKVLLNHYYCHHHHLLLLLLLLLVEAVALCQRHASTHQ
jgi:hypothetical protein